MKRLFGATLMGLRIVGGSGVEIRVCSKPSALSPHDEMVCPKGIGVVSLESRI